jgi:glycosyltransferase involved in cell wall biosynthesis
MNKLKVLYCSYDGLLDPLGQSQILPYLYKIKSFIFQLNVISFEKKRVISKKETIEKQLIKQNINWNYFFFSRKLLFLGKIFDYSKIFIYLFFSLFFKKIDVIHSRGYFPIIFLFLFKKFKKFKIIFDMRGLWFDEKKDCGAINVNNFFQKNLYLFLLMIEKKLLHNSEVIIVLTYKAKIEIQNKYNIQNNKIFVIPCCADYNFFKPLDLIAKINNKQKLKIDKNDKVIAYLGSLGTWYMLDEMILFFENLLSLNKNFYFLIISNDINKNVKKIIKSKNKFLSNRIILTNSERDNLPSLLGCADFMISFIKPYYSKIASSPTKYAESLAMGIPVVSNKGVGDIDDLTTKLNAGLTINNNNLNNFNDDDLKLILNIDKKKLREQSSKILSLEFAVEQYREVYKSIN